MKWTRAYIPACCLLLAACNSAGIAKDDPRWTDTPAVAQQHYREHIWYRVYTRPDSYFFWLENNKGKVLEEKRNKEAITVLAVGDSWFAYPKEFSFIDFLFGNRSNILTNLDEIGQKPKLYTLSLSNSGEIIANMAGIASEDLIETTESVQTEVSIPWAISRALIKSKEIGLPFDYVLLSGGGNDLLSPGRVKALLKNSICPANANVIKDCIDEAKLKMYIGRVSKAYVTLIKLITSKSQDSNQSTNHKTKILAHTYDEITPMPVEADFFGKLIKVGEHGWLYPYLETQNVIFKNSDRPGDMNVQRGEEFVQYILNELRTALEQIQQCYPDDFVVVNTQKSIREEIKKTKNTKTEDEEREFIRSYWLNEIHPTPAGFKLIAKKIYQKLSGIHAGQVNGTLEKSPSNSEACEKVEKTITSLGEQNTVKSQDGAQPARP